MPMGDPPNPEGMVWTDAAGWVTGTVTLPPITYTVVERDDGCWIESNYVSVGPFESRAQAEGLAVIARRS